MRLQITRLYFLILGVGMGCSQPADEGHQVRPSWRRGVGVIESGNGPAAALQAPATVSAGVTFDVTVTTYGGSGCVRPDQADVRYSGAVVDITAYDSLWAGSEPCLPDWHAYPRFAALHFDVAGQALIRLHGRGMNGDLMTEHAVVVTP